MRLHGMRTCSLPGESTSMSIVSGCTRHTGRTATTEVKPMNDPDLLREQVRAWIEAHFDPGMSLRSWLELLADSGWAAPAWPAAWYGKGLPADLAAIAITEFA